MNSKLLKLALAGCLCLPFYTQGVNAKGAACGSSFYFKVGVQAKQNKFKFNEDKKNHAAMLKLEQELAKEYLAKVAAETAPYSQKLPIKKSDKDVQIEVQECPEGVTVSDMTADIQTTTVNHIVNKEYTYRVDFPSNFKARNLMMLIENDSTQNQAYFVAPLSDMDLINVNAMGINSVECEGLPSNKIYSLGESDEARHFVFHTTYLLHYDAYKNLTGSNNTNIPDYVTLDKNAAWLLKVDDKGNFEGATYASAMVNIIKSNSTLKALYDKNGIEDIKFTDDNKEQHYINVTKHPNLGLNKEVLDGFNKASLTSLLSSSASKFQDASQWGIDGIFGLGYDCHIPGTDWSVIVDGGGSFAFFGKKCNIYNEGKDSIPEKKKDQRKNDAVLGPTVNTKYTLYGNIMFGYNITQKVKIIGGIGCNMHFLDIDCNDMGQLYRMDNSLYSKAFTIANNGKVPDAITAYNNSLVKKDYTHKCRTYTFNGLLGVRGYVTDNVSIEGLASYDFGKKNITKDDANLPGTFDMPKGFGFKLSVAVHI